MKRIFLIFLLLAALAFTGAAQRETIWTDRQTAAHEIAERAREMGLNEDNPIIVESKRIWHEEEDAKAAPAMTWLGRYWITGYDTCYACCGKTDGITASGAIATVGRTCAANGFDFGTVLYIDGLGERVVEDRGALAGNTVDVLCEDHPACYAITGWYDVYVMEGEN